MIRKLTIFISMLAFIYAITFSIFLNDVFPVPAPMVLLAVPLFFAIKPYYSFSYHRELIIIIISLFFIDVVSNFEYKSFLAAVITIVSCALYFNYFVDTSVSRFRISIALFLALLGFSMLILCFDHYNPTQIDPLRAKILGEEIKQSPAGIATTQFTFGYQLVAFCTFATIACIAQRRSIILTMLVACISLVCLFLGMNRSAFLVFALVTGVFLITFYHWKAIMILAMASIAGFAIYFTVLKDNVSDKNNILAKNEAKEANDFNRGTLAIENLKIMEKYPYGLIFYGKTWEEVTYRSLVFVDGISSHNAYLMFITYLGPFLGIALLLAIYLPIFKLFWQNLKVIHKKEHAVYTGLLFSFLAVSLNALSHNGWLLSVDGPTLFLYFAILHYHKFFLAKVSAPIQTSAKPIEKTTLQLHT